MQSFRFLVLLIAAAAICMFSKSHHGIGRNRPHLAYFIDEDIERKNRNSNRVLELNDELHFHRGHANMANFDGGSINASMTAVIHIGPHKTGTTTIQSFIRDSIMELARDNYELPGDWENRPPMAVNMMDLAKCFKSGKNIDPCEQQSLDDINEIARRQSNILITAETLAYSNTNISVIQEAITPWNDHVIIVAYYRRFYDWLVSYWNQFNKDIPYHERKTFVEYLKNKKYMDTLYFQGPYVYGVVPEWKEHFRNVKLYNLYDLPLASSSETFFCDALPNARQTCESYRDHERSNNHRHVNESPPLVYDDLVYAAIRHLNIMSDGLNLKQLAEKARTYQEVELGLTEYDFEYLICPDEETLDWLLERTLDSERKFFPSYFTSKGESEIRQKFEKDKNTKLCTVDARSVVENNVGWQHLFLNLDSV